MLALLERFRLLGKVHRMQHFNDMIVFEVEVVFCVVEEGVSSLYALGISAVGVVMALLDHAKKWRERI